MQQNFDLAFDFIMDHEDAPRRGTVTHDRGGCTRWGIASVYNPGVDVANLPLTGPFPSAAAIYLQKYYLAYGLDELRDPRIAAKIADCLVNPGTGFVRRVQMIAGTPQDGVFGPLTIGKLNLMFPDALLQALCAMQKAYYMEHDADSPALPDYLRRAADVPKIPQPPKPVNVQFKTDEQVNAFKKAAGE